MHDIDICPSLETKSLSLTLAANSSLLQLSLNSMCPGHLLSGRFRAVFPEPSTVRCEGYLSPTYPEGVDFVCSLLVFEEDISFRL